ncbi:hypothetical protein [Natronogracilivirga saccharolytica]|uniref:Uncharacterized protein n=1 Tax=Natronogracilivirga saccharolytica TaxID=2812953 RepID=A0A8J7RJT9_9BACT|nr:hypothetical protein [Natronogracilivirga saccharolytica]MBP3193045.1 hypothetical protein [Natronogracilivirga saccharolytica]
MLLLPYLSLAQGTIGDTDVESFRMSGSISSVAHGYTTTLDANRRAPWGNVTTANLNFSAYGFRSGLNVLYNTDQSQFRQNINSVQFDAAWQWLQVSAGDVSPAISNYGLRGVTMRGGHIRMNPGRFLFEAAGGRSQRKVMLSNDRAFREPAFERWTAAGKIGVGRQNRSYFHLSSHYSRDERHSLGNAGLITPSENLTVTPDMRISMFGGRFNVQGEITGSVFTRDLNSKKVPVDEVLPEFFAKLYKPTTSTRVTYAGRTQAELSLTRFSVTAGYERIQPGFQSLGLSRIRDDQQRINVSPSMRFFHGRLNVSANVIQGRDNLLGNRLQTQSSRTLGTNIQAALTQRLMVITSYSWYQNDISTDDNVQTRDGLIDQLQNSHTLMLQPSLNIISGDYSHSVSVTGTYMTLKNELSRADLQDMSAETITAAVSYSIVLPTGLTLNSTGNYMVNDSGRFTSNTYGITVGGSYAVFQRSLNINLNTGANISTSEVKPVTADRAANKNSMLQLNANLNASYRVTARDSFNFLIRTRNNQAIEGDAGDYTELESSLRYQRTF